MTEDQPTTEVSTEGLFFGNPRNLRHRPFLVITETARPNEKANTSRKGWMDQPGQLQRFEQPSIVDRVSNKHMVNAAFIIDIVNRKLVKNRYPEAATPEEFVGHYMEKYAEHITRGLEVWAQQAGLDALANGNKTTGD